MMRNGKILFSSLKGGVGKSSASCAVAAALAADGYKTVIADLDFRSRSLDLMLGVADRVLFTFDDYLKERCSLDALLVSVPVTPSKDGRAGEGFLKLCPAPSEVVFESDGMDAYDKIPEYLERLAKESGADYVVCDTGADSRMPAIIAGGFADFAIVVSEQSRTALRAAEATAARFTEGTPVSHVRLLINNFDIDAARRSGRAGILEMIDGCAVKCIGVIPADPTLAAAQDAGRMPSASSPVTLAAANIARRIQGVQTPLFHGMKKERRRAIL